MTQRVHSPRDDRAGCGDMESGYEEGNRAEPSRIKQCGKGNQMAWHATIQSQIDHEQRGRRVGYKTLAMVLKEDQREKTGHGRWQASRWNTQMEYPDPDRAGVRTEAGAAEWCDRKIAGCGRYRRQTRVVAGPEAMGEAMQEQREEGSSWCTRRWERGTRSAKQGGTVRREARCIVAGIGMESGRYRNGKRRQRDVEWCNADMVQEERRSWQVQDGRVEAEWCYGKSAGLRQVQGGRGEAEWRNGKEWVEAATESDGEDMRRKVRRKSVDARGAEWCDVKNAGRGRCEKRWARRRRMA
jgi:hypothetical protein